jgi:ubiquinone/menaquinone biosynthesis C-methylase UbiE
MLKLARQEAEQHRVADRCEFIQAGFLKLDLEDRFDTSIAMGALIMSPSR